MEEMLRYGDDPCLHCRQLAPRSAEKSPAADSCAKGSTASLELAGGPIAEGTRCSAERHGPRAAWSALRSPAPDGSGCRARPERGAQCAGRQRRSTPRPDRRSDQGIPGFRPVSEPSDAVVVVDRPKRPGKNTKAAADQRDDEQPQICLSSVQTPRHVPACTSRLASAATVPRCPFSTDDPEKASASTDRRLGDDRAWRQPSGSAVASGRGDSRSTPPN
jgi:hypothetical protein